jgi:methylated-DNA-protein-cysteine methyltransferase related protein
MAYIQNKFDEAVWRIVSSIAAGSVMSYGEVARIAGFPRHARMVSRAMSRSPESLPWYRVIRSDRTLAFEAGSTSYKKQRSLLEAEGVRFVDGKVVPLTPDAVKDLDESIWGPDS